MNVFARRTRADARRLIGRAALLAMAGWNGGLAQAAEIDASPDWTVRLDNTVTYNLGVRAQRQDSRIANNPAFAQSEYSHPQRGDVVTNRINDLIEFDAQHGGGWGVRASASVFKDFAFHDHVRTNPGELAPGTPYSAIGTYDDNRFSDYTKRYYKQGGQLLDAFAFSNFKLGDRDASLMMGRLTKFWGNATFFGALGINYAQNAADNIKGSFAPGTEAKELAIPREQIFMSGQLTPELVLEGQYFFKFQGNRLPEGGTYLGFADFLTRGPDTAAALGLGRRGPEQEPDDINDNFGLRLSWAPTALRGAVSVYYRQLDETAPWMPMLQYDPQTFAVESYHLAYAQRVKLFGVSLERQFGPYSVGLELSHRRGTGLSSSGFNPADPLGREGAKGNVTNVVANMVGGLTRSALWDTGVFLVEAAYQRLGSVTDNESMFKSVDNLAACPSGSAKFGCATRDASMVAALFQPQWLGVAPSVDLSLPIFLMYGVHGNAPGLGVPVTKGTLAYTIGLKAVIQQKYSVTLQYNGYHAHAEGLTNAGAGSGVPNGTPGFPVFYAGGSGTFMYNDRGWVSLTLKTSF